MIGKGERGEPAALAIDRLRARSKMSFDELDASTVAQAAPKADRAAASAATSAAASSVPKTGNQNVVNMSIPASRLMNHDFTGADRCKDADANMTEVLPVLFTPERKEYSVDSRRVRSDATPGGNTEALARKRPRVGAGSNEDGDGTCLLTSILDAVGSFQQKRPHPRTLPEELCGERLECLAPPTFDFFHRGKEDEELATGQQRTSHHCLNRKCNSFKRLRVDRVNGEIVCVECGCVQPRKVYIEEEVRLFADDDQKTRNNKIRAGADGTAVGEKSLALAHVKLDGPTDAFKNKMWQHLVAYSKYASPKSDDEETVLFGSSKTPNSEKETMLWSYGALAARLVEVQTAIDQIGEHLLCNVPVKTRADVLCVKFGAACYLHDRDCASCCGSGPSCRLASAKRVPVPLVAAALLRLAQIKETGESIQLEVYKSTLANLGVSASVSAKMGKAYALVADMFKGIPFPCFAAFDPDIEPFRLAGEQGKTVGFFDINLLAENLGFTYAQAVRVREILEDWAELPPLMPQTLMGMGFLRVADETRAREVGISEVSKIVGITETTLNKHLSDTDELPFPTRILDSILANMRLQTAVGQRASEYLLHWLGVGPESFEAYKWTRETGPWLTAACAAVRAVLDSQPDTDLKSLLKSVQSLYPSRVSAARVVERHNAHPDRFATIVDPA